VRGRTLSAWHCPTMAGLRRAYFQNAEGSECTTKKRSVIVDYNSSGVVDICEMEEIWW
jgi:hypothetical protein